MLRARTAIDECGQCEPGWSAYKATRQVEVQARAGLDEQTQSAEGVTTRISRGCGTMPRSTLATLSPSTSSLSPSDQWLAVLRALSPPLSGMAGCWLVAPDQLPEHTTFASDQQESLRRLSPRMNCCFVRPAAGEAANPEWWQLLQGRTKPLFRFDSSTGADTSDRGRPSTLQAQLATSFQVRSEPGHVSLWHSDLPPSAGVCRCLQVSALWSLQKTQFLLCFAGGLVWLKCRIGFAICRTGRHLFLQVDKSAER